jgi:hypothetical protein
MLAVFAPGVLLLVEGWAIREGHSLAHENIFEAASAQITFQSKLVAVLAILVGGFAVYTTGTISRTIAWTAWAGTHGLNRRWPFITEKGILTDLRTFYGPRQVNVVLRQHPSLRAALVRTRRCKLKPFDPSHRYVLAYTKLWLIKFAPEFSVRHFEAEINLLVALLNPILLMAVVVGRVWSWGLGLWALGAALVVDGLILGLVNRRQKEELFQALSHFMFAHWFSASARTTGLVSPGPPGQLAAGG